MNFENKSESLNSAMESKKIERDQTKRNYLTHDKYWVWCEDEKGNKYKLEYFFNSKLL